MFFDNNGVLKLDEIVINHPQWKKIMDDSVVTEDELAEQTKIVTDLLKKVDDTYTEEQKAQIEDLLAQISVLFAAYHVHEIQKLSIK